MLGAAFFGHQKFTSYCASEPHIFCKKNSLSFKRPKEEQGLGMKRGGKVNYALSARNVRTATALNALYNLDG
jgi:hypothetical protein